MMIHSYMRESGERVSFDYEPRVLRVTINGAEVHRREYGHGYADLRDATVADLAMKYATWFERHDLPPYDGIPG